MHYHEVQCSWNLRMWGPTHHRRTAMKMPFGSLSRISKNSIRRREEQICDPWIFWPNGAESSCWISKYVLTRFYSFCHRTLKVQKQHHCLIHFFMYVHVSLMEISLLTIFIGLSHQLRDPDTGLKLGLTKGVFVWLMITAMTSYNTTEQYWECISSNQSHSDERNAIPKYHNECKMYLSYDITKRQLECISCVPIYAWHFYNSEIHHLCNVRRKEVPRKCPVLWIQFVFKTC